jgi:hypothetical protein
MMALALVVDLMFSTATFADEPPVAAPAPAAPAASEMQGGEMKEEKKDDGKGEKGKGQRQEERPRQKGRAGASAIERQRHARGGSLLRGSFSSAARVLR